MMWEDKLKIYDEKVDQCPGFDGKGKTVPCTSYMFSILNKKGNWGFVSPETFRKNTWKIGMNDSFILRYWLPPLCTQLLKQIK